MSIYVKAPISTEVIESNPDCKISGDYEDGGLVVTIDTRYQNHQERLGIFNVSFFTLGVRSQLRGSRIKCLVMVNPLPYNCT